MHLLYLALAYFVGLALGRLLWEDGWWGCDASHGGWLVPFALLPLAAWLHHRFPPRPLALPMRWPPWAGFEIPRATFSLGLAIGVGLCVMAGVGRYASRPLTPCLEPAHIAYWALPAAAAWDRTAPQVVIEGVVASYPLAADRVQRMVIAAHTLSDAGPVAGANEPARPVQGLIRLNTDLRQTLAFGLPVRVTGRLVQPADFDSFSYRQFLAVRGIHAVMYDARVEALATPRGPQGAAGRLRGYLYALRSRGERFINRTLPEPHAALANGMLLGIEAGIPPAVYERFNRTSTSHVIVISGANVAVVIVILMALGRALWRGPAARGGPVWCAVVGVVAYTVLVGGDTAVTRAAIMGSLAAIGLALGRPGVAFISLAAAAWLMAGVNPTVVWDASFQLSVAATAGILFLYPFFNGLLVRVAPGFQSGPLMALYGPGEEAAPRLAGFLRGLVQDGLLVTLAANLAVAPLILLHFGRLSLTALPANFLIAPVQPYIMMAGASAVVADWLGASVLGAYLLWIPWLCLEWTWSVVNRFAELEGEGVTWTGFGPLHAAAAYLCLAAIPARHWLAAQVRRPGEEWGQAAARAQPVGLALLAVAVFLVWRIALTQPDGYLHVVFLDVGQGDGIFVQTPQGRQVLIDGGPSPQRLRMELAAVMPFWDRAIDLLVLTHPDSDHMDGQSQVPARYRVRYALDTEASRANPKGEPWRRAVAGSGAEVVVQHAGGWVDLGDGVALWVLWPPAGGYIGPDGGNENSLVLKLVYGDFSVLLTGDAGLPSEADLLAAAAPVGATVLKVGHHGSRTATGPAFVRAVRPWLAVIQVGENRYGHPHEQVLDHLAGHTVLRTDRHGRIHLRTDGTRLWVQTER